MMGKCSCLKRDLAGFAILMAVSTAIGLFINQFRAEPLPWIYLSKAGRIEQAVSAINDSRQKIEIDRQTVLTLEQFRDFVNGKKGIVLDARPGIFYRLGHVPGAVSLSRDDFERVYAKHRVMLEKDQNRPIAIYCSGEDCEDSDLLHGALVQLGYRNVSVFRGGWTEWTRFGLPEEQEQ
jgi:rhodanese-related sulfurtransferase